jgi:hypothetical protein
MLSLQPGQSAGSNLAGCLWQLMVQVYTWVNLIMGTMGKIAGEQRG